MRIIVMCLIILSFTTLCFAIAEPAPQKPSAPPRPMYPIASQEEIDKYFTENPKLSKDIKEAILDGQVILGMEQEAVLLIYGKPYKRAMRSRLRYQAEVWQYKPDYKNPKAWDGLIGFKNKIVVIVEEKPEKYRTPETLLYRIY